MKITGNQSNTTDTPNINPPLAESWTASQTTTPARRFRLLRLLPKLLLFGSVIFLLVILGQVIAAYKVKKQFSNFHLTLLCPMKEAFDQTLGFGPFDEIDCSGDYPGKQTTVPQPPQATSPYFGLTCSQNPNQEGCLDYCYQHPDELGCPLLLANHCAVDFGDPICTDIICTYAPNLCGLCGQFPTACEQVLQRYLGL